MNIGVDIRALGNKKLTGVGKYILNSLRYIIEQDKENNYYLFSSGLKGNIGNFLPLKRNNFEYHYFKFSNKVLNLGFITGLGPKMESLFPQKIDLFWLPNINFCRFSNNTPNILTVHDLSFLHSREFYSLRRRLWHKMVNVRRLVNQADKIIAVSENTKRDIVRFFPKTKEKIIVINPGVECINMDKERAREMVKNFYLPEKFFLYVGTLEPRKNINSIIRAFDIYHKENQDTYLVIVGGKGWIYEKLLKKINKRPYVKYLDYVDSPQKDALYILSQGLVWPSFYEGFGFPPMEALSLGVPVISSYKTSLPEILKKQALYVDPYNVADIYRALQIISKNDKLKKELNNYDKGLTIPEWPEQAEKIIKLFNSFKR